MKKLLSLALISSLLLGTTSVEAGNKLKKTWAYTKIGYGVGSLLAAVYLNFHAVGRKAELKKEIKNERSSNFYTETLEKDYHTCIDFNGDLKHSVIQIDQVARSKFDEGLKKGKEVGRLRYLLASPLLLIPLGIFSIQSGRKDLRRIKKQELKEKK